MPVPKKRTPKTNPAPDTVTVTLPRQMPKGVEFVYLPDLETYGWKVKTRKGLDNLLEMAWGLRDRR